VAGYQFRIGRVANSRSATIFAKRTATFVVRKVLEEKTRRGSVADKDVGSGNLATRMTRLSLLWKPEARCITQSGPSNGTRFITAST